MQIIAKRRQRYTRTDRQRLEKVNEPMFFSSIAMPQHGWKQKSVSIKWKANSRVSEQKKKSQRRYIYLCGYNNCCLLERTDFNNPLSHSIRFDSIITLEKCSAILLERCRCASSLHSNGAAVVFFSSLKQNAPSRDVWKSYTCTDINHMMCTTNRWGVYAEWKIAALMLWAWNMLRVHTIRV